jgi:hypothetical protein
MKSNTLSISPRWDAFGFIHANYGKVINDGKNEYQLMHLIIPDKDGGRVIYIRWTQIVE